MSESRPQHSPTGGLFSGKLLKWPRGKNGQVDDRTVIRSLRGQAASAYFGLVALVFGGNFLVTHGSSRIAAGILALVCIPFVVRGWRSGYLAVTRSSVTVRTFYRTKVIEQRQIASVAPVTVAQVTLRVFPVITLVDGTTYKLSEFFSQKRRYEKDAPHTIVTKAIEAINAYRT